MIDHSCQHKRKRNLTEHVNKKKTTLSENFDREYAFNKKNR